MKKYLKPIITICILLVIAVIVYFFTQERVIFNEGYVNGNTAGNLYNSGMICENNGTIFFANPNDGNKLYSMDLNGENLKKLNDDIANYINADEHYVYYVRNNVGENLDFGFFSFYRNALCRIPRTGGTATILDTDPCNYATLIGNYIYYLHYDKEDASTLYKVKIDGTDRQQVRDEAVFTCAADGQYFYYHGMNKTGSIFRFDTTNDISTVFYEGNCYKPVVMNNGTDIYYVDGDQNTSLVHVNTKSGESTVITTDSIDAYNIYGDYIYYQKYDGDDSGLCRIKTDGTDYQMIRTGDFYNIQVTSNYVFFTDYHSNQVYYFLQNAPETITQFDPDILTN